MGIVVVGKGFVGEATGLVLGDGVAWQDPAKGFHVRDFSPYTHAVVCVPTPLGIHGLEHGDVVDSIRNMTDNGFSGILVIRSTCEPWFLKSLQMKHGSILYWPEFLRERYAEEDSLNPRQIIIGGEVNLASDWGRRLRRSGYGIGVEWTITDLCTASVIKLGLNSALAAKVMMFNALHAACGMAGADWETVRHAVGNDPRIGAEQTMVPGPDGMFGFGGKCLPKDLSSFHELVPDDRFIAGIIAQNSEVRDE